MRLHCRGRAAQISKPTSSAASRSADSGDRLLGGFGNLRYSNRVAKDCHPVRGGRFAGEQPRTGTPRFVALAGALSLTPPQPLTLLVSLFFALLRLGPSPSRLNPHCS